MFELFISTYIYIYYLKTLTIPLYNTNNKYIIMLSLLYNNNIDKYFKI